ncbi:hypothetical protein CAEBREN_03108 [Caenorhabditis brenneri]|uniref:Cysteine-rich transmembrane CYSTM domain-containing protein n=1 Tax=Caenorhabditis brenneri TaxID=135651 RepID=G0NMW3_CAEBE|nr:hypothetical protein CAEBREN_03108 [Caenorhabditis brenneri]
MSEPTKTSPGYPAVLLNSDSPIVSQPAPDPPAGYYRFNDKNTRERVDGMTKDCCFIMECCRIFTCCFRSY